jgi:hypothetical protein
MSFHIECLIDISGSMKDSISDLVYSYNNFLNEQQILNIDNNNFTWGLNCFNHKFYNYIDCMKINNVPNLQTIDLKPQNTTSLLDSIAYTIQKIDYNISQSKLNNDKVIVVIMTDGIDNNSKNYYEEQIKNLIFLKEEQFNWKFVYLGANQNAIEIGKKLGISENCSLSYKQNSNGIYNALKSTSNSIIKLRKGEDYSINFNELDRLSSLSLGDSLNLS